VEYRCFGVSSWEIYESVDGSANWIYSCSKWSSRSINRHETRRLGEYRFVSVERADVGETPCLMSEIGIPYDMDNKKAFVDGKYTGQYAAMDANNYALERAGLSFTLWTYCPQVSP
jgi:hypothetical protein